MKTKTEKPTATSQVSQYCLDTLSCVGFVKSLPKNINIYNMRIRGTMRGIKTKLAIPEYIKDVGITSATSYGTSVDVKGNMTDTKDKQKLLVYLDRIAKSYSMPIEKLHIVGVTITDKEMTSSLTFRRQYKQIRFPNDKRRKKLVLGMSSGDGADYHDLLAKLSAKKIVCTLAKTEKTIVLCSEEVVKK